jgi:hypothetical protein
MLLKKLKKTVESKKLKKTAIRTNLKNKEKVEFVWGL